MLTGKFGSFTFIVIAGITGFITLFGAIFLKAFPILLVHFLPVLKVIHLPSLTAQMEKKGASTPFKS